MAAQTKAQSAQQSQLAQTVKATITGADVVHSQYSDKLQVLLHLSDNVERFTKRYNKEKVRETNSLPFSYSYVLNKLHAIPDFTLFFQNVTSNVVEKEDGESLEEARERVKQQVQIQAVQYLLHGAKVEIALRHFEEGELYELDGEEAEHSFAGTSRDIVKLVLSEDKSALLEKAVKKLEEEALSRFGF